MSFDLYIYWKRFIYKSQTNYIFIVNDLYIDRYLLPQKLCFDLKSLLFLPFWLQKPLSFRCLFRIIPNSSSLLKTFFVCFFSTVNMLRKERHKVEVEKSLKMINENNGTFFVPLLEVYSLDLIYWLQAFRQLSISLRGMIWERKLYFLSTSCYYSKNTLLALCKGILFRSPNQKNSWIYFIGVR